MSSTNTLEEKVEQIKAMLRGRVNDLRVSLNGGRVVLVGKACTYYAKQLAQHHAQRLLGASSVVNEIEVHNGFMLGPFHMEAGD
jgi:osmotically-inducible protein OsmY